MQNAFIWPKLDQWVTFLNKTVNIAVENHICNQQDATVNALY